MGIHGRSEEAQSLFHRRHCISISKKSVKLQRNQIQTETREIKMGRKTENPVGSRFLNFWLVQKKSL
jgi:hypothetical protein